MIAMNKFEVSNMDLYYGNFHALKNINISIPENVFSSTRTLAVHMYLLSSEGLHVDATYGTAVVLLVLVLLINCLSSFIAGKLAKGK